MSYLYAASNARTGKPALAACALVLATLIPHVPVAHGLAGGSAVSQDAYPAVVQINTGERSCSGVLVHAEWILTLSDCFGELPPGATAPPPPASVTLGRADLRGEGGVVVGLHELSNHPSLGIVLAKLDRPVPEIRPVTFGSAAVEGETLVTLGFGRTATEWAPDRLYATTMRVAAVSMGGIELKSDNGVSLCQGDAGGPLLRQHSNGLVELVGIQAGARQGACFASGEPGSGATALRADQLAPWLRLHAGLPAKVPEISRNLARDATFTASSSAENWGWFLAKINDGNRTGAGWSSWSSTDTDHTEWIELAFPGGVARDVNRVDLYPRTDPDAIGFNFPVNFTVDVWTDHGWETVVAETGHPPVTKGERFRFPTRSTTKIRVQGTNLKFMQFAEVEVYLSANLASDAKLTASSSAENWGWYLANINDGVRTGIGWSSWSSMDTDHTEWIELAFPDGVARDVNRVDLYPRSDPDVVGLNYPVNLTIDVWAEDRWETVVARTDHPAVTSGQKYRFPTRSTTKIRVQGTNLRLMQFAEIEVYSSENLASDATFSASSSAENWGWFIADINDGQRDEPGWTSWSSLETDHTEWIELAFPNGSARPVNRIELYPRVDLPPPGNNFPASFTIDVWSGGAWQTVVSKRDFPAPDGGAWFAFPTHTAERVRVTGSQLKIMQLNELEAYHVPIDPIVPPAERLPSIVETGDYPHAAALFTERGILLRRGDGHITLAECGPNPSSPPADLISVQTYDLSLPAGPDFCFKAVGTSGYLSLEVPYVYAIRGDDAHALAATLRTQDQEPVVEVERVDPREWQPVGAGQSRGDATLLELRYPASR